MKDIVHIKPIRPIKMPDTLPEEDDNLGISNLYYAIAFEDIELAQGHAVKRGLRLSIEHYMLYMIERYTDAKVF